MEFSHVPVLLEECIQGLAIRPSGIYVDGTAGGAGHSREIAKRLGPQGRLIAIDKDPDAVAIAGSGFREFPQATVVQNDFANIPWFWMSWVLTGWTASSWIWGCPPTSWTLRERAFPTTLTPRLDMRMSQSGLSAYDIVNTYSVGTSPASCRGVQRRKNSPTASPRNIEKARQQNRVETTFELVEIIKQSIPAAARREGAIRPNGLSRRCGSLSTRSWITCPSAWTTLLNGLPRHPGSLVITFHSLRIGW